MPDNDTLMTVNEVAEYLRVDPNTVYRWITDGKLPHHKLSRTVRISREQLKQFMEAKK